ncbi:MAG: murein hydrolase activator EnvC family protein [Sciscionella sp.]
MVFGTGARVVLATLCAGVAMAAMAQAGALGDRPVIEPLAPTGAGATAPAPVGRFGWPLAAPHPVLRGFQPPVTPYGPGHRGVDLGGSVGQQVLAAGDGLVLFAGRIYDRTLVSIEHDGGLRTTYEPIAPAVKVGQRVRRGELIGYLQPGHFGCAVRLGSSTVCLHWGARRGETYLDPLRLVLSGGVRLLPWLDTG